MGPILLGTAVLVLLLYLIRAFVSADTKVLAGALRQTAALVLGLLAVMLLFRANFVGAIFVGLFAWFVFRGGRLWPQSWSR